MKFLIFSDIHGAADSARFIVKKCEEERPDKVLILGDILYHGPRNDVPPCYEPKTVISELSRIKDMIIAVRGNCEAEVDQMVLPFPVMSEEGGYTHFFSGHTHLQVLKCESGIVILNPGSITLPKGGTERSYATYIDGKIAIRRMSDSSVILEI